MELHNDAVERILEMLPVESLVRFKSVSKQWKSMIEAPYFKKKLLIRRQSQDPDILIINPLDSDYFSYPYKDENLTRMFRMASWDLIKLPTFRPDPREPTPLECYPLFSTYSITGSCDGMICYHNSYNFIYVVNPITRWSRSVPQSRYQDLVLKKFGVTWKDDVVKYNLGFGKDKFTDTYKLVWLYNSFLSGLENATTCEVFDFSTNAWSNVTAAPCCILANHNPVYVDGLLHWFTDENITETRVLSFDLHTETFHIISKTPFVETYSKKIVMSNVNNRLCISQKEWPIQEIWFLENSDMTTSTWEKIYSLNLQNDSHLFSTNDSLVSFSSYILCAIPLTILKKKKKSLVLYDARARNPNLITYDPDLKSYDICFSRDYRVHYFTKVAISFFPSLISIV